MDAAETFRGVMAGMSKQASGEIFASDVDDLIDSKAIQGTFQQEVPELIVNSAFTEPPRGRSHQKAARYRERLACNFIVILRHTVSTGFLGHIQRLVSLVYKCWQRVRAWAQNR